MSGEAKAPEQDASLLRELADEAERLVVLLSNATSAARDLRDRAYGVAVLGLRPGFGDAAYLRERREDVVKYMVGAAARQEAVEALTAQLPE